MNIEVPGPGCANCRKLAGMVRQAVAARGVEAEVVRATDIDEIIAHDVPTTPGLAIGGQPVSSGRAVSPAAVADRIRAAV
jgi:small redox-active disulfide protein 2